MPEPRALLDHRFNLVQRREGNGIERVDSLFRYFYGRGHHPRRVDHAADPQQWGFEFGEAASNFG